MGALCSTYLVGGTAFVGTKHDDIWRGIGELVRGQGLVVSEQLHVGTTALETFLELDLILDDKILALVVDGFSELGRDGVVSSWVLHHKTLVASNARVYGGLLYRPLADVGPVLIRLRVLLLCMRRLPPCLPVVGELFEEGSFQVGGLCKC